MVSCASIRLQLIYLNVLVTGLLVFVTAIILTSFIFILVKPLILLFFSKSLAKLKQFGIVGNFRDISSNCDNALFKVVLNSHSCIHQLLPSVKNEIMQLRPRGHKFTLPNWTSKLHKDSFVNRYLFTYI
jgi:hypothetical protein